MELPKGWTLAHADRLFAFVTSGSRGWAQYYSEEGPPFIRIGDLSRETLQIDYHNAQRVRPPLDSEGTRTRVHPGDLLISITADLGILGVVSGDVPEAYINQHIALARPHSSHSSKYIGWYLASWDGGQRQIRSMKRGATKVGLGLEDIRSLVVPLPSRSEQEEIVRVIETQFSRLDTSEARLNRALVNLRHARASVLKAAVDGRLGNSDRSPSNSTSVAVSTRTVSLREVLAEIITGPFGSALHADDYVDGGIPVVNPQNLRDAKITPTSNTCISEETAARLSAFRLQVRDVVVGRRGEMGRCAVVRINESGWLCGTGSLILRLKADVSPEYLTIYLRSPDTVRHLQGESVGSTMHNLNQRILLALQVPLPPLAEQHRIVAEVDRRLSVLDRLEARITANLSRCKRLRQAILKRAFEGRLVPQEPT